MTDNELIKYYSRFYEKEHLIDELQEFLDSRQNFLEDENKDNSIIMRIAFDKIYNSTKHLLSSGQISENDFFMLKSELSNVDRIS